jgi:hypothetical protein
MLVVIREELERRTLIHILIALINRNSLSYTYTEWNYVVTCCEHNGKSGYCCR